MIEVDVYRVFYESLQVKPKYKLTEFLSNTMEGKYFSGRVRPGLKVAFLPRRIKFNLIRQ